MNILIDKTNVMVRITFILVAFFYASVVFSQIPARMFRSMDVSQTQIAFVYGSDLWIVSKEGGIANRLSSPSGVESFPKFSPDGSQIAFSGNYDGNQDVYVVPSMGGLPTRITYHSMPDRMVEWMPDGSIVYASSRESEKQRFSKLYQVSSEGGFSTKMPMAYGEYLSPSPDGKKVAMLDKSVLGSTWKRYEGGSNGNIWIFDLHTLDAENITQSISSIELPMWHQDRIYYLSDRGPEQKNNLWMYNLSTKKNVQVTFFKDGDIHMPSLGPSEIVFEYDGDLHLLDLATHQDRVVSVQVVSDMATVKPYKKEVSSYVASLGISPDGNRALVEARGEIFSLPAKEGIVVNLTHSSGSAERYPAWSPDGKKVAYWSDASGEYELTVSDITVNGPAKKLTNLGPGFRYNLFWSPDSKKIVWVDQTMQIRMYDFVTGKVTDVDKDRSLFEGELRGWKASWSPDSKWLVYGKTGENNNSTIFFYEVSTGKSVQATSGFYSDRNPSFDPEGKYLYLTTNRHFNPIYSDIDHTWIYSNSSQVAIIPLTWDVASPFAAKNDTVSLKEEVEEKTEDKKDSSDKKSKKAKSEKNEKGDTSEDKSVKADIKIDFNRFEDRMIILPLPAGNYDDVMGVDGSIIYLRYPNTGSDGEESELKLYNLKEKEEKTIVEGVWGYQLSADGKKVLISKGGQFYIIDPQPDQKPEKSLPLKEMEMVIDPPAEWKQLYTDAWRLQRDFFYDKNMHGVDWNQVRMRYEKLLPYCVVRNDVNFLIGEMIGELNASHTYRWGGDLEVAKMKNVGYLGIDWAKQDSFYYVGKIIRGAAWDSDVRSPLDAPGLKIKEGDFILAVNGMPLAGVADPYSMFEGLAGKSIELTVNVKPEFKNAWKVIVKASGDETVLRNRAWIESNRQIVDKATNGRVGYVYVPSTGTDGQSELVRQYAGQWHKEGLIIDERFNNGGQIPDRFIELLNRKALAYFSVRDGAEWQWPPNAHVGSIVMLINGWSGSGGDAFPDYFRRAGLGPLVGTRTWGGLIGISGTPSLIDGGLTTVPTFRMYHPDGNWFREGHGVDPDIEVPEDPSALAKGRDTQLEKAIEVVLERIKAKGPMHPKVPEREDRSRRH